MNSLHYYVLAWHQVEVGGPEMAYLQVLFSILLPWKRFPSQRAPHPHKMDQLHFSLTSE